MILTELLPLKVYQFLLIPPFSVVCINYMYIDIFLVSVTDVPHQVVMGRVTLMAVFCHIGVCRVVPKLPVP